MAVRRDAAAAGEVAAGEVGVGDDIRTVKKKAEVHAHIHNS